MQIENRCSRLALLILLVTCQNASLWAQSKIEGLHVEPSALLPSHFSVAHSNPDGSPHILFCSAAALHELLPDVQSSSTFGQAEFDLVVIAVAKEAIRLPPDAQIKNLSIREVGAYHNATYSLTYGGIIVRDRFLTISISSNASGGATIISKLPSAAPQIPVSYASEQALSDSFAKAMAREGLYAPEMSGVQKDPIYFASNSGAVRRAWGWTIRTSSPDHLYRVTLDAETAHVLEVRDLLETVGANELKETEGVVRAKVHLRSPFDTLTDVPMIHEHVLIDTVALVTDSLGKWSTSRARRAILSASLQGLFQHVKRLDDQNAQIANDTLTDTDTPLLWTDSNSNAAERDAYYSVGVIHDYTKQRDPTLTLLDTNILVNVNVNSACNAHYDPLKVSLSFYKASTGDPHCVNTAEVSDIVYHEYGHRVNHCRWQSMGKGNVVDGSLSEAFADLNSNLLRDDPSIGTDFYGFGTVLRTSNNVKKWPQDINQDIHETGRIITGAYWDLRKLVGIEFARRLFQGMSYFTPDGTNDLTAQGMEGPFLEVLISTLMADDDDANMTNGTPHSAEILKAFSMHGIALSSMISLVPDPIPDQDFTTLAYPLHAKATSSSLLGKLENDAVVLHYSTDNGKTYSTVSLHGTTDYVGSLQKLPAGTLVRYFYTAQLDYPGSGSTFVPDSLNPSSFLVGFKRSLYDDCSRNTGWSLRGATDSATTGKWVQGKPFGTFDIPGQYIQQDTDHSANDTACYVTGNYPDPDIALDDVDDGQTTLTTPLLDLSQISNPVIRYWFYYRNNASANAFASKWLTQISSDGGLSWKTLQFTNTNFAGWTKFEVRAGDYILPTSEVKVQFVASDYIGAIVEAGVDDLEILTGPEAPLTRVYDASSTGLAIGPIRPNPTSRSGTVLHVPISLSKSSHVLITVRDVFGNPRGTLLDQPVSSGNFDGAFTIPSGLAAGVYWITVYADNTSAIRKLVLEN